MNNNAKNIIYLVSPAPVCGMYILREWIHF